MSRDRSTLHISKADEFCKWAEKFGYKREPVKGLYEVFRLRSSANELFIGFKRDRTEHVTVNGRLKALVETWLRRSNG